MHHTSVRSWTAIGVGLFFAAVTGFVLLEDIVRHGAPVTPKHVMTLAVLGGTIFFGHRWWPEFRGGRLGTMLGCSVLFLAGTAVCVLMSAGRNAEVVTTKTLVANAVNTDRERARNDRDEAKARYLAALKAEETECGSGQGEKCRSKRITTTLRREDFDTAERVVRAQQPEQVANADIRAAADLVARLPYVTASVGAIEALLQLLYPFLQSLFCEIAAITAFSIGLAHAYRPQQAPPQLPPPLPLVSTVSTAVPEEETVIEPEWTPMSVNQARDLAKRARAEAVFDALRKAGRPVSNDELAELMSVSKAESSRRATALVELNLIQRWPRGRYVAISLRPLSS